jgi:hypothetical protein
MQKVRRQHALPVSHQDNPLAITGRPVTRQGKLIVRQKAAVQDQQSLWRNPNQPAAMVVPESHDLKLPKDRHPSGKAAGDGYDGKGR